MDLSRIAAVTHDYLRRCVAEAGTDRVFGLKEEAQRHLQRTLDLFFARNAREDYEWPSREDLLLKKAWLEQEVEKGGRRQELNRSSLAELNQRLEHWKDADD